MRIFAKLVDYIILMIISISVMMIVSIICNLLIGADLIANIENVYNNLSSAASADEGLLIYNENKNVIFMAVIFSNIVMLTTAIIYFAIAGKYCNGSIGKKIFKFTVESDKNISYFTYIKREPIIYLQIITLICSIVSYFIYIMFFVQIFAIVLVVCFIRYKEFWNKNNNVQVVKLEY